GGRWVRGGGLGGKGRVRVVVNNAGVALIGRFEELEIAEMEWLFAVNFWGTVRMCKAFVPALRREPAARIVNLSSIFGVVAPAGQTAHAASKFAGRGFSEALRPELENTGLGGSTLPPGSAEPPTARTAPRAAPTGPDQA